MPVFWFRKQELQHSDGAVAKEDEADLDETVVSAHLPTQHLEERDVEKHARGNALENGARRVHGDRAVRGFSEDGPNGSAEGRHEGENEDEDDGARNVTQILGELDAEAESDDAFVDDNSQEEAPDWRGSGLEADGQPFEDGMQGHG